MVCGNARWVAGLLCACAVMLGPLGQPVDNKEDASTLAPQMRGRTPTSTPNTEVNSSTPLEHYVRQSQLTSAGEQEFVLKRKKVVLKSLNRLGIGCSPESVPHIALLGSGGGQRAAVGLMGSLYQMEQEGLLDTLLYLGGVSGSAWSMSSIYSDPDWSTNMARAVSRLSGPGVELEAALAWLEERAEEEHFSLSDIWGLMTSAGIMKQLDLRNLSTDGKNAFNPYPVYSAVNKDCLHNGPVKGQWFEMTPHEAGFTELGFFINTSHLGGNLAADRGGKRPEMDMIKLQGIVGCAIADERSLLNVMPDWLKGLVGAAATVKNNFLDVLFLWTEVPQQINDVRDVMDRYMHGYRSLLKLTEVIRANTEDPAVLSDLDNLQITLKEKMNLNPLLVFLGKNSQEEHKLILEQWRQELLAPFRSWSRRLDEAPTKDNVSLLIQKVLPLIGKWEWGTTENFLYQYPGAAVPSCIKLKERLQLIDAGLMLNTPYPPFLGGKRDADLLIALDYGADDTFKSLTNAREYAMAANKPFPEIDDNILEETEWPKDCYVFRGKQKEPTIIYMPLFNRRNCKDAKEAKAKMEEFSTFQLPYSREKIEFVLETAKANVKNNKETLLGEIHKAVIRRRVNISGG